MLTREQSERLRTSIALPMPCCTGTLKVSPRDLVIYYGKGENACQLDLLHASDESLERLAAACEPATFGLNHENVHDESYRKARKLGLDAFSPTLDPTNLKLINIVRDSLLRGSGSQKMVRAELYNLNVYGKDSFFKPHVDTPHDPSMFGSLVIFYPTRHQGGELIVRQEGKEWAFDSANVLSDGVEPRIGYAAFYSDIEHEVKTITAGHRVTITYNLYFEDSSELLPSAHASAFKAALQSLLLDETFLPNGGRLAFGLQYSYPLPKWMKGPGLKSAIKHLKGSDAEILQVAMELSLEASLSTLVKNDDYQYLCEGDVPSIEGEYFEEGDIRRWLKDNYNAKRPGADLHWITKPSWNNEEKQAYIRYGNEATINFTYNSLCVIMKIGKFGSRSEQLEVHNDDDDDDDDDY